MKQGSRIHPLFLGLLAAALLVPAYVGFRLPNYWSATLTMVSLQDGFVRRSLIGTVFKPIWSALDYAYPAFAIASMVILAALLACILVAASRAQTDGQRLVALLWILAPTGAYLFHLVGYLDLVLYLLLFGAILLADRRHLVWASALMTASALVHENMLLVTLPVFAYRVLAVHGFRKALLACLAPAAAVATLMLLPRVSTGTRELALAKWDSIAEFPMRYDAVNLQARSLTDAWELYSVWDVTMWVIPIGLGIVLGWILLIIARRRAMGDSMGDSIGGSIGDSMRDGLALGITAMIASLAPLALAFLGWDASRWNFLALSNFALLAYAWLGSDRMRFNLLIALGVTVPFLPLFYQPLAYFDEVSPRPIAPQVVVQYLQGKIPDGFLALPKA